ncbi:hypothetical protein ABVK25_005288 [Lepraria finkii]|uniref:Protein RER1 n=1 Tax=Lepraria finkii TaxID=1340010 RepID=A0ABR4BA88_9LECA
MDSAEPEQTPFAAVSAQTSKLGRIYQSYLDKCTPYTAYRWVGTGVLLTLFFIRILVAQGWYIVCYSLGIYLLNLFLAFLQPKFDPSLSQDEGLEDGEASAPTLPTKQDEEFRPFIRRLPEFKFWHSSTRAIAIAFFCTWFGAFNVPVFWPVLVVYFVILLRLTSSEETDTAHDQIPLCPFYFWQGEIQSAKWALNLRPRVCGHRILSLNCR